MRLKEYPIGDYVGKCQTWNPKSSGVGNFDYIDLSSVDKDTKSIASIERYECSNAPSRARQLVETDDVLVATVRPNLNGVSLVNGAHHGMTASTGYCVLRPDKDKLDSRFLFHWVKTGVFVQRMVDLATGANYPAVSDAKVKASKIPLPPLAEQKRIAWILDAADALRGKRREALAQLDTLLQSTFLDMFGDPVTNPMGWVETPFGDIATDTKLGLVRSSKEFGWDFGIPYVRMNAVTSNGYFLPSEVQSTHADEEEAEVFALQPGDFLFNTRNSKELVGKVCVFPGPEGWLFNNNLMRVRFRAEVEPWVIAMQFRFRRVQRELEKRKSGTTSVFAVYWKSLRTLPVLVPPSDLQHRFAAIVESVEQQKASQREHLAELDTLFASLQSRAFRGDL